MKNITLKEYAMLSDNNKSVYDMIIGSINPSKTVQLKSRKKFITIRPTHTDLWDFSYSDMIELKTAFAEMDGIELTSEIVRIVYRISNKAILNMSVFSSVDWVVKEFQQILEIEKSELDYEPDEKEKSAGVADLARFGHHPSIRMLCKAMSLDEDSVLALPYHKIFHELCYQNTMNTINKNLANVSK